MSQALRKRGREAEASADSEDVREPKRFQGEETDRFLDLLQLDQTLAEEEEECAPTEELVSRIMRGLEEEINGTFSNSDLPYNSRDNSVTSDTCTDYEVQTLDSGAGVDLSDLLDVSDYELGIPPRTALDLKDEVCLSQKETSEGVTENPDLKYVAENWHFEDDFGSYQQFALYEDPWNEGQVQDYLNTDCISPRMLFEGDFSEAW